MGTVTDCELKFPIAAAILFIIGGSPNGIAAPKIESITTIEDASSSFIEVNGSGFTNGPKVILFDDFEIGKPGDVVEPSNARVGAWNAMPTLGAKPYYHSESAKNTGFLARDVNEPQGSQRPILKLSFGKPYREVFISYSVKVPGDHYFAGASSDKTFPDVSSWKFAWIMSNEGLRSEDSLLDIAVPSHVGGGNFLIGGNDGNVTWIARGENWWSWHDFNNMAFHIKVDSTEPTKHPIDWTFEVVSDKKTIVNSGKLDPDAFSNTDYQFDKLHIPGWWGNGDVSNFQAIYDNVYVAAGENSQSRVIVTDSESFSESSMAITLPTRHWSENTLQIDLNLLPSWDQVFFHIVNSSGERTASGKPLCPKCPATIDAQVK